MSAIRELLQNRLDAGEWRIGQVLVRPGISLRHVEDSVLAVLEGFARPEDAREIAKYDATGAYRPLKTAPNLRRGWLLELASVAELQLALDFFYPAALGTSVAFARGGLAAVPLRDTLDRQTGMYRVTQLVTDEQARGVIQATCVDGCIRKRLWDTDTAVDNPHAKIESSDILCAEACNLLVAACRPVAKSNLPKVEPRQ